MLFARDASAVFAFLAVLAAAPAQAQTTPTAELPSEPPPPDCTLPADGVLKPNCVYSIELPHLGSTRSYKLLVPAGFTLGAEATVVLDYHGWSRSKSYQITASCWKDKARRENFVVAYPHGTGFPVGFDAGDFCCWRAFVPPNDEVKFAKDVAADVKKRVGAPSTRWKTYASGLSNGGAVAHNLGCEANDVFDAIAPVSQTFSKDTTPPVQHACLTPGERHLPVIDFRATRDDVIPYYDDGDSDPKDWLTADESIRRWAVAHQCTLQADGQPVYTQSPAPTNGKNPPNFCRTYTGCKTALVQCTVDAVHALYTEADAAHYNVCELAWELFQSARPAVVQ